MNLSQEGKPFNLVVFESSQA